MKIKITENKLRQMIQESIANVLDELNNFDNHNSQASQNSIDNNYDYEGELWDEETGWHGYLVSRFKNDDDNNFEEEYNIEDEDTEKLVSPVWFDKILEYDQNYPRMLVLINGKKAIFDYRHFSLKYIK